MPIRTFFQKNKFVTHSVLISYVFMSIGHSCEFQTRKLTPDALNLAIILPDDLHSKGNRSRTVSEETHTNTSPFSATDTPTDSMETDQLAFSRGANGAITIRTMPIIGELSDEELIKLNREKGIEDSKLEGGSAGSGNADQVTKNSTKKEVDTILVLKTGSSIITSLAASSGLALFSYKLGLKADEGVAYVLGADAIIANAILYHKILMGLTIDDFKIKTTDSPYQKMQILGGISLKFSIALIASIPLAFVTYLVNLNYSEEASFISCIASLICTIPLFYKAQTALLAYIKQIYNIVYEENEQKRTRKWRIHNATEELSALSRDDVHGLYKKFLMYKENSESMNGSRTDDILENFISDLLPTDIDTEKRFWLKEGSALAFGGFSAVFGGMYLFLVGNPIYEAFLPVASNAQHLSFLSRNYKTTSLVAAIALTVGQNALQAKTAYDISKLYAINGMRSYEKKILHQHASMLTKRNISVFQQYQEFGVDFLKAVLAAGAATARAALALNYIENPALLACVLVGTDISYFATFWWGMGYIESGTNTELQRSEMIAFLNSQKTKYIEDPVL